MKQQATSDPSDLAAAPPDGAKLPLPAYLQPVAARPWAARRQFQRRGMYLGRRRELLSMAPASKRTLLMVEAFSDCGHAQRGFHDA